MKEQEDQLAEVRAFYDGQQIAEYGRMEPFIAAAFAAMFKKYPACNLIKTCVKVVRERLRVTSVGGTGALATLAAEWWKAARLESWQSDLYRNMLRDGAAVLIVGWDGVNNQPTFTVNELYDGAGGTCRLHFDSDDQLSYVSRRWQEHDENDQPTGNTRLTVYFPDRIERYYQTVAGVDLMTPEQVTAEDPNVTENPEPWVMSDGTPIGIAAVPFFNAPYEPEPADLMADQVGINESILSWHVAGRYGGFRTIVTENARGKADANGNEVPLEWGPGVRINVTTTGNNPAKIYTLPAEDVEKIFAGAVVPWLKLASFAKRFPYHVFDVSAMPTSGELLRQMEGPMVEQIDDKKPMLDDSWADAFDVARKVAVVYGGQRLAEGEIEMTWKTSQSSAALYDMEVLEKKQTALGIPQRKLWQEAGYSDEEITNMLTWKREESAQSVAGQVQRALLAQQGNPEDSGDGNDGE